jgi:hypothetical protein
MRHSVVFIAAGLVAAGTGCTRPPASREPGVTASLPAAGASLAVIRPVAAWSTPAQLARILDAAHVRGDKSPVVWVPGTGYVTGAPDMLATIGQPLPAVPGQNHVVEPCRASVLAEASKLGAIDVEAALMGPERRDRTGRRFAPVDMRITYKVPGGYELRRATLTCIVDRSGRIVDAYS